MILDSLARHALYRPLGAGVAAGLEYLRTFDPATEEGRYPIRGDAVFALVQSYHTAPGAERRFESHHRHLDLQYVAAGRERILHAPVESLEIEAPYSEERDVVFYREPAAASSLLLSPGDFAILYPGDGHKPGCMAGGRDAVKKVVVKVRL